jgi:hypothetical protein
LRQKLDDQIQQLATKYEETTMISADLQNAESSWTSSQKRSKKLSRHNDMIGILSTQLSFTNAQDDVLSLFQQQILAIDDDTKAALFMKFGSVLPSAKPEARDQLSAIYKQLEGSHAGLQEFQTKTRHLSVLTRDHNPLPDYI